MRTAALTCLVSMVSAPAFAQGSHQDIQVWNGIFAISASPRIGRSLPFRADDIPVDESEAEISVAAANRDAFGFTKLESRIGVASSPQLLDDSDAASAIYAQVTVGDSFIPFRRLLLRSTGNLNGKVADAWRPYARYRFTRNYANFFRAYARSDHQVTAGIRYRDVRTIMADSQLAPATEVGAASETVGWYWEARAEGSQIWSTDDTRKRFTPLVRLDVYSRPVAGGVRIFARSQGDVTI